MFSRRAVLGGFTAALMLPFTGMAADLPDLPRESEPTRIHPPAPQKPRSSEPEPDRSSSDRSSCRASRQPGAARVQAGRRDAGLPADLPAAPRAARRLRRASSRCVAPTVRRRISASLV